MVGCDTFAVVLIDGGRFANEETIMAESPLTLSTEERQFLLGLLELILKDTRVEEHRTRTPSYRDPILQREHLIAGLLNKLRQAGG